MSRALAKIPDAPVGLPAAYAGPWPTLLREALAYHEVGHAIMAAHHGMVILNVWIADGRPPDAEEAENPDIHGACLCAVQNTPEILHDLIAHVNQILGPVGSEPLAPHRSEFAGIHRKFPDFFNQEYKTHSETCEEPTCEDRKLLQGTVMDVERAFDTLLPLYKAYARSPKHAWNSFGKEFRIPLVNVMKQYEPVVHALARTLMDRRFIKGDEAHAIICQNNPDNMPGCTQGEVGHALKQKIMDRQKEFEAGEITLPAIYDRMFDDVLAGPGHEKDLKGKGLPSRLLQEIAKIVGQRKVA